MPSILLLFDFVGQGGVPSIFISLIPPIISKKKYKKYEKKFVFVFSGYYLIYTFEKVVG